MLTFANQESQRTKVKHPRGLSPVNSAASAGQSTGREPFQVPGFLRSIRNFSLLSLAHNHRPIPLRVSDCCECSPRRMTARSWQPLCYVLLLALSSCQRASCSLDSNPVPSTTAATTAVISDSAPLVDHHRQHVPETDDIGGGDPDSCLGSQHQHQRQRGENMVVDWEEGTNKKPHSPPALDGDEAVVEVRKGEEAAAASTTTAPGSTTDDIEDEGQEGVDSSRSIPERYILGCGGDVAEAGRR